ncbi:MAG: hypothetical protein AAF135_23495 [Bacteroidota bacterium]
MDLKFSSLFLILALSLLGCSSGNVDLDNAGDQDLTVQIDELVFKVPAGSYKLITLDPGRHSLTIKDAQGVVLDEKKTFNLIEGGLINLSKSDYIVWTELYGDLELRKTKLNEEWFKIGDASPIYGEFERLRDADLERIYVEKRWDFGLSENFPETLTQFSPIEEKFVIRKKLFRESELLDAYSSQLKP